MAKKAAQELQKATAKAEKTKRDYLYAMTGNFGYKRALIPIVLRHFGLHRVRFVTKKVGMLLIGEDHKGHKVTETYQYKKA